MIVATVLAPLLLLGSLVTALPARADDPQRAKAAADWLYAEGKNGMPGFTPGSVDTGLTIDAMWGLMAAGSSPAQINGLGDVVADNANNFATGKSWGHPRHVDAGAMGKVLLAAGSLNRDPSKFGGIDARQLAASTIRPNGQAKNVDDEDPEGNQTANMFGQTLVMMGLARTGELPSSTVDFLVSQQCQAGYFRMYYYEDPPQTCDQAGGRPDVDGTAMAVMALLAAKDKGVNPQKTNAALTKALDYLERVAQQDDGSFGGGVNTEGRNANSTGMAAAALAAGGRTGAADRANTWMAGMQLTRANAGKASGQVGALAYDKTALEEARKNGIDGLDQWRRSTAQAILAFAPVSYHKVGISAAPPQPKPDSPITKKWKALGGDTGRLGAPTGAETCNLRADGCTRTFQHGSIFYSASTGAQPMFGALGDRYRTLGSQNSPLGYPTDTENCTLKEGGCVQHFQYGLMYWSPGTGANPVWGAIEGRYASVGWEWGALGYPTDTENCTLKERGCVQHFQHGLMYFSPATGANPVWGAIRDRYAAQGWEWGPLGYPKAGEFCNLRGGGCGQHFQGGSIYFSPASGAWPAWGAIRDHWARNGYEWGRYGYPTGPESCRPGECRQSYQGGVITWNATRGTF